MGDWNSSIQTWLGPTRVESRPVAASKLPLRVTSEPIPEPNTASICPRRDRASLEIRRAGYGLGSQKREHHQPQQSVEGSAAVGGLGGRPGRRFALLRPAETRLPTPPRRPR